MNIVLTKIINLKGRTKTISSSKRINANEICQKKKKKKRVCMNKRQTFLLPRWYSFATFWTFFVRKN